MFRTVQRRTFGIENKWLTSERQAQFYCAATLTSYDRLTRNPTERRAEQFGDVMKSDAMPEALATPVGDILDKEVRRAIELELSAICNDQQFRASQRNCAFLQYVVAETLAGRAAEIKERTLGRELFGRPIDYDTGSDAVVRVRANDVRRRLGSYYEDHTSQRGWRVQLPLRSYVPVFVPEEAATPIMAAIEQPSVVVAPRELPDSDGRVLTFSQMVVPTLVALFLCAATFRWQAFAGTPYLDFWETLLSGHRGIALVLDADPADPKAVTTDDLQAVSPLLKTAHSFNATTQVASSAVHLDNREFVAIHVTRRSPFVGESVAAYITVVPGREAELWIGSSNAQNLDLAISSMSDSDIFPTALETAIRRRTPTLLRFAENQPVTTRTLPAGVAPWKR
jgi:hypothetical protein